MIIIAASIIFLVQITDASGEIVLDATGEPIHFDEDTWGNDLNNTFAKSNIKQHRTNKMLDDVTGLYYCSARWYDPETGRFISVSPLSPMGEEEYVYCYNDPVDYVDLDGENPLLIGAIIGGGFDAWSQLFETGGTSFDWGRFGVAAGTGAVGGQVGEWVAGGIGKLGGFVGRFFTKTPVPNQSSLPAIRDLLENATQVSDDLCEITFRDYKIQFQRHIHPLRPDGYLNPVDHFNIRLQVPSRVPGRWVNQPGGNFHYIIDENGIPIKVIIK